MAKSQPGAFCKSDVDGLAEVVHEAPGASTVVRLEPRSVVLQSAEALLTSVLGCCHCRPWLSSRNRCARTAQEQQAGPLTDIDTDEDGLKPPCLRIMIVKTIVTIVE